MSAGPPTKRARSPGLENPWERKAGVGAGGFTISENAHEKQGRA
jgi:hypothetical protein